jgi:carbonic anhydrase/acetyltransferase-like protein (isoleucine patch superfamily)
MTSFPHDSLAHGPPSIGNDTLVDMEAIILRIKSTLHLE